MPPVSSVEERQRTATREELLKLLDERDPTPEELWMFANHFAQRGFKRTMLAARLGVSYWYLKGVLFGKQPITPSFRWRLRQALGESIEPILAKQQLEKRKAKRAAQPRVRISRRLRPETQQLISRATALLATGSSRCQAAKSIGVSYVALRDCQRRHPQIWAAELERSMTAVMAIVRAQAGTDAIEKNPERYMRMASAAARWTKAQGIALFESDPKATTLTSFFHSYYKKMRLVGGSPRTVESYESALNQWALLTGDPPLIEITNLLLARVKECLLKLRGRAPVSRRSPNSVRSVLKHIQAVLDKAGPPTYRNRDAAGLLPSIPPWVKPPAELLKPVRIVDSKLLDDFYAAAIAAELPQVDGIRPAAWWRALITVAYNTCLRRRTLLSLKQADVDIRARVINVRPDISKNRRGHVVPLNDVALWHLRSIMRPDRDFVFPWPYGLSWFHGYFRHLQKTAGIKKTDYFGLHSLRKRHISELYERNPAAAQASGQHGSMQTTEKYYVASLPIITKAVEQLSQPASFLAAVSECNPTRRGGEQRPGHCRKAERVGIDLTSN